MIFRLRTHDTDAEGRIGEGFFDDSNELNDILGHKRRGEGALTNVQGILDSHSGSRKQFFLFLWRKTKNVLKI